MSHQESLSVRVDNEVAKTKCLDSSFLGNFMKVSIIQYDFIIDFLLTFKLKFTLCIEVLSSQCVKIYFFFILERISL